MTDLPFLTPSMSDEIKSRKALYLQLIQLLNFCYNFCMMWILSFWPTDNMEVEPGREPIELVCDWSILTMDCGILFHIQTQIGVD